MKKQKIVLSVVSVCSAVAVFFSTLPLVAGAARNVSNKLVNGNFNTGDFTGYEVRNASGKGVVVREHNGSYAAYLPGKRGGGSPGELFVNQKVSLKAGEYIFKFNADIASYDKNDKNYGLVYGIYTALGSYNRGYASGKQIAEREDVSVVSRDDGSAITVRKTSDGKLTDDFRLIAPELNDDYSFKVKVSVKFTLIEDKEIYLSVGVPNADASGYIDDLTLKSNNGTLLFQNGDFEEGDLSGYIVGNTTGKGVTVKNYNGGYASYLPGRVTGSKPEEMFLNQKMSLKSGSYILSFEADIANSDLTDYYGVAYGIYTNIDSTYNRGLATGKQIVERDRVSIINRTDNTSINVKKTGDGKTGSDFKLIPDAVNDDFSYKVKVKMKFDVSEDTDLYFSIGSNSDKTNAYIDNITLIEEDKSNLLENGNFEEGDLSDYSVINKTGNGISVKEYNDSFAAFLPGRANGGTAEEMFLNQKLSLPAGKYVFSFDADIAAKKADTWGMVYGVYTKLGDYNRGYNSGNQFAVKKNVSVINRETGADIDVKRTKDADNADFIIIPDRNDDYSYKIKVTVKFELTDDKDIFISLGCHTSDASAYVDNLKVAVDTSGDGEDESSPNYNGGFELGNTNGYVLANKSKIEVVGAVKAVDDGKAEISGNYAAYLPGRQDSNITGSNLIKQVALDAGKYVVSFNADIISDSTAGSVDFGVHTGNWNTAFHRGFDQSSNIVKSVKIIDRNTGKQSVNYSEQLDKNEKSRCFRIDAVADATINCKVYAYFEITDTMVSSGENKVYFCISFPTGNRTTRMYLDDILFENGEPDPDEDADKILKNGDFEKGNLNGYTVGNTAAVTDPVRVIEDPENPGNHVAYLPERDDTKNNPSTRFINQKISLTKGWYEWTFDARLDYTSGYGLVFGVYGKLSDFMRGYGQADKNQFASQADSVIINTETNAVIMPGVLESWNDFMLSQGGRFKVTVRFYVADSSKDAYLSLGIPNVGAKGYIDNMAVNALPNYSPVDESKIRNGDFEKGNLEGYIYSYDVSKEDAIRVVDYNGSKAAYLPKRNDSLGGPRGRFLNQSLKLNSGRYILEFDVDFQIETPSAYTFYYGMYEKLDSSYQRGLATGTQIADASDVTDRTTGTPLYIVRKAGKDYYFSLSQYKAGDVIKAHVTLEFELEEAKTVYFSAGINAGEQCGWLDNIKLGINTKEKPVPQTYDDPKTVYYIDFEGDKSQILDHNYQPSQYYERSTDTAHSGKYSARFNPESADGYKYLCYTDNNGYNVMEPTLKPNTAYRFSFWYNQPGGDQNVKYGYQPLGQSIRSARVRRSGWQQFTYDFKTGDNPESDGRKTIWICAAYFGKASHLYFDDIKLEELTPSVLSVDETGTYCEEYQNKIENGRFEKELNGTIWDSDTLSVKRIKATDTNKSDSGDYFAHFSGDALLKVKIKVRSNYVNKFAFSYRMTNKTNLKIGILDNSGNVMPAISGAEFKETSLITPTNADGEWHRLCYSFLSPIDGYVYFYIEGSSLDIDLDEISLFRNTQGYDEDPNMIGKNVNTATIDSTPDITPLPDDSIIGDNDFDFNGDDDVIIEEQPQSRENNKKTDAKKENGSNVVLIIISSVAAVLAIAGISAIVFIKKRNGKKVS